MIVLNIILYYFIIIPISILPYPILYGFSSALYYPFYYLVGYRKKIILDNISRSFPEKSAEEHIQICKKFYRHFCDIVFESVKAFTITESSIKKRVKCINPEVIDKYFDQNRSVIIAGGHINNWEMFAIAVNKLIRHNAIGIYKPFSNKFIDKKMFVTRSKYGLYMISTKMVKQTFEEEKTRLTATIFGIDQSPSNPENAHWMTFLNQDTPVLLGTEKFAKEYNYPVVYGRINKLKRGYYSFEFFDVTDKPQETKQGEITEKITQFLERDIKLTPEFWLWSHRRWKHKRKKILTPQEFL